MHWIYAPARDENEEASLIGPFDTDEHAVSWAGRNLQKRPWHYVFDVVSPDDWKD